MKNLTNLKTWLAIFIVFVVIVPAISVGDVIVSFPLDSNPGWSTQGDWEFGVPLGGGSSCGDPTSGHTGTNVYGYNLSGDYTNSMPEYYLATTALDCSRHENVVLNFWRWLGVESASYDHATVEVSNDGSIWSTVWDHASGSFCDGAWIECDYDISSVADGQGTVYIRWSMGPTDGSVTYPGWNIDDVSLLGDSTEELHITPSEDFYSSGDEGGPFDPPSKTYTLTNIGSSALEWTASSTQDWLDNDPNGGTLNPGDPNTMVVSLNAIASALPGGAYNDTVTFTNITSGIEQNREVMLDVIPAGVLFYDDFPSTTIDPANWPIATGVPTIDDVGIAEPSEPYSLRLNADPSGGDSVESRVIDLSGLSYGQVELRYCYEMTGGGEHPDTGDWLHFEYWNGSSWMPIHSYEGGGTDMTEYVCVTYMLPVDALHAGFKLKIRSIGSSGAFDDWFVDDICIIQLDDLSISPSEDFESSGYEGGPFDPPSKTYTLTNDGVSALEWTASSTQDWLDIDPNGGTLNPGDSNTVVVSLNAIADTLDPGTYADSVAFTNTTGGTLQIKGVTLDIMLIPGEIEVTDSIPEPNDLNMPFGEVVIGLARTEHITITNSNPDHELVVNDISLGAAGVIEDFEDGDLLEYTIFGGTHIVSNTAAHDGYYGLESDGSNNSWIYRDDETVLMAQGDTISFWVNPPMDGRVYCGFGASAGGTYSITAAPNNNSLVLHLSSNYSSFIELATVPQAWTYDKWYRLDVEWSVGGNITGRLYDSDGTTLLNTVSVIDNTYIAGGIAFRAFDADSGRITSYFDTVERWSTMSLATRKQIASCLPSPADVVLPNPADAIGWDEENQAPVFDESELARVLYDCEESRVTLLDIIGGSSGGFRLENEPSSFPVTIPSLGEITFDVIFDSTGERDYESVVVIQSNDEDEPEVEVLLSGTGITDYLEVFPEEAIEFRGHPGGPFVPCSDEYRYRLTNIHTTENIEWTVEPNESWLDVWPESGELEPGESIYIWLSINATGEGLPQGQYPGPSAIVFTDVFTTFEQSRDVNLEVFTAPKIWVTPDSFDVTMAQGGTLTETMVIGNTGDAVLNFNISSRETPTPEPAVGKSAVSELGMIGETMVLEYDFSEPVITTGSEYDQVIVEGLRDYLCTGAPIVPVRPATVLIPFGKRVAQTRVFLEGTHQLEGTYRLGPAQKPYPLNYQGTKTLTEQDPAIYGQSTPWPGMDYEIVTTQSKRGYQLLILNLFPLQYTPDTGEISYTTKLRLEIDLEESQAAKSNVVMPLNKLKSQLGSTVDNPSVLEFYPSEGYSMGKLDRTGPLVEGGPYQYVIITNDGLEGAPGPWNFQALRDVKIARGMTATIVTTEWIYANYDGTRPDGGTDNQTRIRNFLIEAYQTWGTEYVLLGGTNSIVPARMFWVDSYAGDIDLMPVDMYYGCVDPCSCTFDYDADGLYGEPTDGVDGGDVDLYAEIYVGRAAVENATEVENFIRKTLTYDTTGSEYLPRIAMVGEYLGFGGVAEFAKDAMEQIRLGGEYDGYFTCGFENHGQSGFIEFETVGCLPEDPCSCWPLYDADNNWPKSDLLSLMNGGTHVFNHLGHANYTYEMKLYTSDLASLTNTDYFFIYSQGCMPGGFDTTNCFAEVITSMEEGAFAVVMNARYGWGTFNSTDGPSHRYGRQFWDAVLCEGMLEIGKANQDSKEDNVSAINESCMRWCYYELNVFGDPAQQLRFSEGCDWLDITPDVGICVPSDTNEVDVTFNPGTLTPGTYYAEITVTSNDELTPVPRIPVTMIVRPNPLESAPEDGFEFNGHAGGPFVPEYQSFTLTNKDPVPLGWTAAVDMDWLSVTPQSGTLDPNESVMVDVWINENAETLERNEEGYIAAVTFSNTANGASMHPVTLWVMEIDYFTELFESEDNDLHNRTLTFTRNCMGDFYNVCREVAAEFPVDPNGGTVLSLEDDDYERAVLSDGVVRLYGEGFDSFFVGSNGYITFGIGDTQYVESLDNHFMFKRISGLFDDLSPNLGGRVSWEELPDRAVVTFENVPEYHVPGLQETGNNFQIELFFNGVIRITYLDISATDGLAGLSKGENTSMYFEESNLSDYNLGCDFKPDGDVNLADFAFFATHWLETDCCTCGGADLTYDGNVLLDDLLVFAENWLSGR